MPTPLIDDIFSADAALDVDAFVATLTEDVRLRIGSQSPLHGRAAVREAIAALFGMLRAGLRHQLHQSWASAGTVTYEAEVTYHLKDGRDVTLPYVNVLRLAASGLVQDYRIYIDLTPLQAAA